MNSFGTLGYGILTGNAIVTAGLFGGGSLIVHLRSVDCASQGSIRPPSLLQPGNQDDERDGGSARGQTGNISLAIVGDISDGIEDQGPPADESKVERVHKARGDSSQLLVVRSQLGHPRVPHRLRRIRRAQEVEGKEVNAILFIRAAEQDGAADDEGEADAE